MDFRTLLVLKVLSILFFKWIFLSWLVVLIPLFLPIVVVVLLWFFETLWIDISNLF